MPLRLGRCHDVRRPCRDPDGDGVEEGARAAPRGRRPRGRRQGAGVAVDGFRDGFQAFGAVVDGVHGRHDGQQRLRGADIGRGLLAADVLLAGLQRQAVGGDTGVVLGNAHQAAGHGTLEALPDGHVGGVRSAVEQRDAEALRGADGDVRTLLARRRDQRQGQQVRGHRDQGAPLLGCGDDGGVVENAAGGAGLLEDDAVDVAVGQAVGEVGDLRPRSPAPRRGPSPRRWSAAGSRRPAPSCRPWRPCPCWRGASSGRPRRRQWLRPAARRWRWAGPPGPGPWSGSSAAPRAGPGRFRAGRACTRCTRRGLEDVAADHGRGDGVVVPLADHLHGGLVLGRRAGAARPGPPPR